MIRLTKKQLLLLYGEISRETGGDCGVRDGGLLQSALEAPFQSFGGVELFPSVLEKAARLGYGIIKNHPFTDGNKRMGTHAMLVFLALNGIEPFYTQDELAALIISVAAGETDYNRLLSWLREHTMGLPC